MIQHHPKVSILMPVFNTEKYLEDAISSILRETFEDYELLVCDDGSTDKSLSIIHKFSKQDKRIRVFKNETNSGNVASVINRLVSESRAKYVLVSDSDDITSPHRLELLYSEIKSNKECSAVYGKVEARNEDLSQYKHGYAKEFSLYDLFLGNYIPNGCLLFRRSAYTLANCSSINATWAEDYYLRLKLATVGPFKYIDSKNPVYIYRMHQHGYTNKNRDLTIEYNFKVQFLKESVEKVGTWDFDTESYFNYSVFIYQLAYYSQVNNKTSLLMWVMKLLFGIKLAVLLIKSKHLSSNSRHKLMNLCYYRFKGTQNIINWIDKHNKRHNSI